MTAAALLAGLRCRGVELFAVNGTIRVRPRESLTDAERVVLREHKAEVLALLRDGDLGHAVDPAPDGPCFECNTSTWFLAADWPTPATSTWLCRTCCARPSPSLAEAVARLTLEQGCQLEAAAAAGDVLARLALAALTMGPGAPVAVVVEDVAVAITEALAAEGWVVIFSHILGQDVLLVRDVDVLRDRDVDVQVPDEYARLPRFDQGELAVLAAERPSVERLRAIVRAKEVTGGAVVSSVSFVHDQELQALVAQARAAGVRVELDDRGELVVESPRDAVPFANEVLKYAGAVRELLGGEPTPAVPAHEWLAREEEPA